MNYGNPLRDDAKGNLETFIVLVLLLGPVTIAVIWAGMKLHELYKSWRVK